MIELDRVPELTDPVLIAAFEGWNDAADSATAAITHLADTWHAEPIAAVEPDDYYDYQVNRPQVRIEEPDTDGDEKADSEAPDGEPVRRLIWPTTRFLLARPPAAPRDIVLVRGIEPNMRWRPFCAEVLGLANELGVDMMLTLGALLADNPHTRPIPVSATSADPELRAAMALQASRYEGPSGIIGVLGDSAESADLPTISLWAAVPHYVAQPPCPKATLGLLRRVEDLLDLTIPMGDLPEEAQAWERGVDDLAEDDSEVSDYVRSLEEARDAADLPEASGEAIAAEFERYLRRRPPQPPE